MLRAWAKRTATLVDDKIVAVAERFLLPIVVLGAVYLLFSFVPLPMGFVDIGKRAFLVGMIVLALVLGTRLSLLFLEGLGERYELVRSLSASLQPLIKVLFTIIGAGVIVDSLAASRGAVGKTARFLLAWLLTSGLRIILIVAVFLVALRTIRLFAHRLHNFLRGRSATIERQKRAQTLSGMAQTVANTFLFVVSAMLVLRELGVEIAPILATAGIGGLAIGFGAQSIVRDVISGFFILLEDQIRVGDVVRVGDKEGYVESVGLRILTLRGFDGSVHIIPNGTIGAVTNMTKGFSYYVIDVGISYREDVDKVMEVLKEVGAELRHDPEFASDILGDLEVLGVDNVVGSAVTIKVQIRTQPVKQWRVGRELRRRIKKTFDARGIQLP
jgi:small conductance mechanosensitive channel